MKNTALAVVASVLCVFVTVSGVAQEADLEVVVTASRIEEEIDEVGGAVSVITAQDLAESGATTIVDALEALPGVHFRSFSGNPAQAEISMRGFGENAHGRVLVLLDGRKMNRPDMAGVNWLQVPVENIERIEVLHGSNSVLYGDHAVAGVVNIITKRGSEDWEYSVSGSGGSWSTNQERVGVSGRVGPTKLNLSVERTDTDGYRDRSGYNSLSLTAASETEIAGSSSVSAAVSYSTLAFELPGVLFQADYDADPTQAGNPADPDEARNQYVNVDLGFSIGDESSMKAEVNATYGLKLLETDMVSWTSYFDFLVNTIGLTPKVTVRDLVPFVPTRTTIGIDVYLDLLNQRSYSEIERNTKTYEIDITKLMTGIYIQEQVFPLPGLGLSLGARYDTAWYTADTSKITVPQPEIDETMRFESFAYDADVTYTIVPDARVYLSYARVFRYPFSDEIVDSSGFLAQPFNKDLEPERGWNAEVGSQVILNDTLTIHATAYLLQLQNEIAFNAAASLNENLDDTRHMGVESGLRLRLLELVEAGVTYDYQHASFRGGANKGNTIPLVSDHAAAVEATFFLPIGFSIGYTADYVGHAYFGNDEANAQDRMEDYWIYGVALRYRNDMLPGSLEAYVAVENLLDEVYATSGYWDWEPPAYVAQNYSYYPGQGRGWTVGVNYRY